MIGLLLRRLTAYFVDVGCMLTYAGALFVLTLALAPPASAADTVASALRMQLVSLATLTGPVVLAMAWLEASRLQASPGKWLLGLVVARVGGGRLGFGRSLARNALKFLPWEIAHAGVFLSFVPTSPWPAVSIALSFAGMLLVAVYLASYFLLRRQTVYDRVAGARVAQSRSVVLTPAAESR